MALKNDREYRNFASFGIETRDEGAEPTYKVSGYASTFAPYDLFELDGVKYREQIEPTAFDEADMSDVIFLYNHQGMVYARQKNGTLGIGTDEHGLKAVADLSLTEQSRQMYEQIASGLVDQMSFAFTVEDDEIRKDSKDCYTRIIKRIGKVYDVSAVSIPANPDTDITAISARSAFDGVIKEAEAERLERAKMLALAKAKYEFMEV